MIDVHDTILLFIICLPKLTYGPEPFSVKPTTDVAVTRGLDSLNVKLDPTITKKATISYKGMSSMERFMQEESHLEKIQVVPGDNAASHQGGPVNQTTDGTATHTHKASK